MGTQLEQATISFQSTLKTRTKRLRVSGILAGNQITRGELQCR